MTKKGPDETTDRLFPHQMIPESGTVERPLPLGKSIREEFAEHRLQIADELKLWRHELGEALARLSPVPTVGSSLRRGAVLAGKGTPLVAAVLALLEVAIPLLKPEWEGPLKALRQLFGAPQ